MTRHSSKLPVVQDVLFLIFKFGTYEIGYLLSILLSVKDEF